MSERVVALTANSDTANKEQPTFHEVFVQGLPGFNVEAVATLFDIVDDVERRADGTLKIHAIPKDENFTTFRITFKEAEKARWLVEKYHKKMVLNRKVSVKPPIGRNLTAPQSVAQNIPSKVERSVLVENIVFISGLSIATTEEELRTAVEICGKTKRVQIYKKADGSSKGSGTVSFEDSKSATSCVDQFNGKMIGNSTSPLRVQFYKAPKNDKPSTANNAESEKSSVEKKTIDNCVFFTGLPLTTTDEELRDMLEVCGKIKRVLIYKGPDGSSQGRGTVSFELPLSATSCIQQFNGKKLSKTGALFHVRQFQVAPKEDDKKDEKKTNKPAVEREIVDNVVSFTGLPLTATEVELQEMLEVCGSIKRVKIYKKEDGSSKGEGTVSFDQPICATDCIARFNGMKMADNSTTFSVRYFQGVKLDEADEEIGAKLSVATQVVQNVVYFQGLSFSTTEDDLREMMSVCGRIKRVQIYKREDGSLKGEGTVSFFEPIFATRCIERFNGKKLGLSRFPLRLELFQVVDVRRKKGRRERKGGENIAYECVICFETWNSCDVMGCVPIGLTETDQEAHFACLDCIAGHAKSLCTDGTLAEGGCGLPCAVPDCKRVLLRAPVLRLIDRTTVKQLAKRMDTVALIDVEGFEKCKRCHFGAIIDVPFEQMQYFICQTPWCQLQFCRKCKVNARPHMGRTCEEVENLPATRKTVEEALSEAVIRKCAKCETPYQKSDGCNKITCTTCQTKQCYICQKSGIDYDHFGGDCQLFGDAEAVDRERMEKIQRDANYRVRSKMDVHERRGNARRRSPYRPRYARAPRHLQRNRRFEPLGYEFDWFA